MAFALGPLSDFAPQRGNGVNKNIEIIGQSNGWLHGFNTAAVLFTRQTHKTDIVELHMSVAAPRLNHKRVYYMGVIHGPVFTVLGSQGVQAHGHLGPLVVSRNVDSVKTHIDRKSVV